MIRSSIISLIVVLIATVAVAATPDSTQVTLKDSSMVMMAVTDASVDSLYSIGEDDAADKLLFKLQAAGRKAKVLAKKKAEAEKLFWAEADSIKPELKDKKDVTEKINCIDSQAKGAVVLMHFGVPKSYININSSVDEFKELAGQAAMMNGMIKANCVELNGPAHTALKAQDKFTVDFATKTAKLMLTLKEKVETQGEQIEQVRATYGDDIAQTFEALVAVERAFTHAKVKGNPSKDAENVLYREYDYSRPDIEELIFKTEPEPADSSDAVAVDTN